ncbi:bifunctional non-homologous end joining protein LigD [Parapedobacter luteus]|uniref:DNA ligase (ATP) n=1 Tax=Parapedobacter luteus TaxID=623280 RepID=A0A1T5A696_9SPHI|nr:DNA ligase D [Parapedobacter luteus]SKB30277.1 bifunctional non-homologous end joining protein LigD [Parapedobacter luteus]
MALEQYRKKRDFKKTNEPKAGKSPDKKQLTFVIQKHDASRLHYDFRLELGGVLKSWAVPKGPSTDPETKRLAMMVEDHPMDYRLFEGIIPKGEYGGGTVIVWDEGTYEPVEPLKTKKAQEKHLLEQLHNGSLKIRLHGQKLQGEYALVRTRGMGENGWLLIKHKDEFAKKSDITKKDKSVLSGKTIAAVAKTSDKVWQNGRETDVKVSGSSRKKTPKKPKEAEDHLAEEAEENTEPQKLDVAALLKKAPKSPIPDKVKPMKATLIDEPFDDPDWVYEVKWDGYRAVAHVSKRGVSLASRNSIPFDKYYPLIDVLKGWRINALIDGEIVVLNDKGLSDFGALQNWRSEADGNLVYYVFDILWYEGKNLMGLPLLERQAILHDILPTDDDRIRLSKVFAARGIDFFDAAEQVGLEGIMAKKMDSKYTSDLRSKEWLKIKVQRRQEVVIAGFTRNAGTSKVFSALVLGVYDGKKLRYAGKVGTGFSDKTQKEMMKRFKPLITDHSPFDSEPDVDKPSRFRPQRLGAKPTWLKPKLVCEVNYAEVTSEGIFRQASFKGMREDKDANEVVLEKPADAEATVAEAENEALDTTVKPAKSERRTLLNPREETQVRKINGKAVKFTHLSKVYWPDDGITKRDMFNYYYRMAEYILPYLKDRPMSLNRFPNGIKGPSFYQKDVKGKAPEWVTKTYPYVTSEGEHKEYLVGDDEATLLWMASLGCIEMNPWFSRVQSPDNPDYCVIDLDPDKNTFEQVIQAAQAIKKVLDAIEVPGYAKTSGSTGIHIYIPLGAKYTYDQSQLFAKLIVSLVHEQLPDFTSLERKVSSRKGKMYLDFLQNRPGATIAGPYSLRPKPGATVSMPLAWDEMKPGLKMSDFTIHNAYDRLKETGDLFKDVLGKGIDLDKTIKKTQSIFG